MQADLVYDIGFHRGEDTEFYLKKGYRVVAVEADPELCAEGRKCFADAIPDGRLTLVNKAIAESPGAVTFYRNSANSVWGTIDPLWADRNARMGAPNTQITVEATTMAALVAEFGVPYYAKFDIEGLDMVGVEGLRSNLERPAYVSIEAEKDSFKALRHEFDVLTSLGYDRFKIVPQSKVQRQRCPDLDYRFRESASGQFGEDAPGAWLSAEEAIQRYKRIFIRHMVVGDDPLFGRLVRGLAWRLGVRQEWYDTHARISDRPRGPPDVAESWEDEAAPTRLSSPHDCSAGPSALA
jgi:FkbM family methyltransferase